MRLKLFSLIILLLLITSCSPSEVNQTGQAAKDSFSDYDKNFKNEPVENKDLPIKNKKTNLEDDLVEDYDPSIIEEEVVVTDSGSFEVSGVHTGDYFSSTKLLVTLKGVSDVKIKYQEVEPSIGEIYELELTDQSSFVLSDLKSSTTYYVVLSLSKL